MAPVIDSHVHLFDQDGLKRLAWMTPENKLNHPRSIEQYNSITKNSTLDVEGLIFIETDVRSGLEEDQWEEAIAEYAFVAGCEDTTDDKNSRLVKAIIPWVPLPCGKDSIVKFIERLSASHQEGMQLVKGFRYLFQDKPQGTMLQPNVVEGLNWLSQQGYVFDVGIDMHSGGLWQLKEFQKMEQGVSGMKFIVNHLTKPDLTSNDPTLLENCKEIWTTISQTSNNTYFIKLSGAFSEMPEEIVNGDVQEIVDRVKPWLSMFIDIFGPKSLMWGSDWPVCTLKMGSNENAWIKWSQVCKQLADELNISSEIYYENVKSAYNL